MSNKNNDQADFLKKHLEKKINKEKVVLKKQQGQILEKTREIDHQEEYLVEREAELHKKHKSLLFLENLVMMMVSSSNEHYKNEGFSQNLTNDQENHNRNGNKKVLEEVLEQLDKF